MPAASVERLKQRAAATGSAALPELGAPLPPERQRRMLALGRKANRGALAAAERAEYEALIRESDRQAARDALAALATREPARAAALGAEAEGLLGRPAE